MAPEPAETNPFDSPEATCPPPSHLRAHGRGLRIALLVFMGLVLLPAASFAAGFCCCLGSMAITTAPGGAGMAWGFSAGAVLGGALVVLAMIFVARAIL